MTRTIPALQTLPFSGCLTGFQKLRPFFPPLDQVQSLNLRAALLRGLEQAKKNGVLGRDAVVRKTMLDECKGERLEEVLASFSSAVLKKLVAERSLNGGLEFRPTISEKLALENWGYTGDRSTLNALILAHRVSLSALLADKNTARQRYKEFEHLLYIKEKALARRNERVNAPWKADEKVTNSTREDIRKIVKTNWTGNERWIDSLLFSDTKPGNDGFLGRSFDEIWTDVEDGQISDLEDHNTGLLDKLDERVRLQKARLEKWNGYRERMFGTKHPDSPREKGDSKSKECPIQFDAHKRITISEEDTERVARRMMTLPTEYADILEGMKADFESMKKAKIPDISNLIRTSQAQPSFGGFQNLSIPNDFDEPIADMGEFEDEAVKKPQPGPKPARLQSTRIVRNSQAEPDPSTKRRQLPQPRSLEIKKAVPDKGTTSDSGSDPDPPKRETSRIATRIARPPLRTDSGFHDDMPSKTRQNISPDISPKSSPPPPPPPEEKAPLALPQPPSPSPPPLPPRRPSHTQVMADQILASMSNASPSPAKNSRPALSLAERARISMSRTRAYSQEEPDFDPLLSPSPGIRAGAGAGDLNNPRSPSYSHTHTKSEPANSADPADGDNNGMDGGGEIDGYEDLVARTRRSMAGYEAARQKAQLERRRSLRRSRMPQRRDTQPFPPLDEEGYGADASIVEELLDAGPADVDMETVFRSRPKIAASPPMSPVKLAWDDGV